MLILSLKRANICFITHAIIHYVIIFVCSTVAPLVLNRLYLMMAMTCNTSPGDINYTKFYQKFLRR